MGGAVTIDIIRHEPKKRDLNRNMMNEATPEDANYSFYHAFEELSIQNMDKIWSHNEGSSCVHPGWELVVVGLRFDKVGFRSLMIQKV